MKLRRITKLFIGIALVALFACPLDETSSGSITITLTCPNIITSKLDEISCTVSNPDTSVGVKKFEFSAELSGSATIDGVTLGGEAATRQQDGKYLYQSDSPNTESQLGTVSLGAEDFGTLTLTLVPSSLILGDDTEYTLSNISISQAIIYVRPACDEVVDPARHTLCIDHNLTPEDAESARIHFILAEEENYITGIEAQIVPGSDDMSVYDIEQPDTNNVAPDFSFSANSYGFVMYGPNQEVIDSDGDLVEFTIGVPATSGSYMIYMEDVVAADTQGDELDLNIYHGQVIVE